MDALLLESELRHLLVIGTAARKHRVGWLRGDAVVEAWANRGLLRKRSSGATARKTFNNSG
jgi:hypothetical protein